MFSKLKRWWRTLWVPPSTTESVYDDIELMRHDLTALLIARRVDAHHVRLTTSTDTLAQEVRQLTDIISHLERNIHVPYALYDIPPSERYVSDWLGHDHADTILQLLETYCHLLTRLHHLSDTRDDYDVNFRAWSFLIERYSHRRMELKTLCQQLRKYQA